MTAGPRGPADLILYNIGALYPFAGQGPRRGDALGRVEPLARAAVAASDGTIVFVGPESELENAVVDAPDAVALDARGRAVLPGFVDPHTHAVYAGERVGELRERLAGTSYQEIMRRGGGILSTVRATREASLDELVDATSPRLDQMLLNGTTTAEVKSGYGLTTSSEVRMLEAIRELDRRHPVDLVPTFLGAHEIPPEFRDRPSDYVELVVDEMLPAVTEAGLAEWCDVFCEVGVFSVEQTRRILEAAAARGLKLRLHADEFAASGGAELAVELGARSADHLMRVSPEGIRALASSPTAATLLPAASFYLKQFYAPGRALVDAGAIVALATDLNPGGGLSPSMPFVITLAALAMGLSVEEALAAATVNAAYAVDRLDRVGSLEVGKRMDALVLSDRDPACLLRVGASPVDTVIKNGRVVVEGGRLRKPSGRTG